MIEKGNSVVAELLNCGKTLNMINNSPESRFPANTPSSLVHSPHTAGGQGRRGLAGIREGGWWCRKVRCHVVVIQSNKYTLLRPGLFIALSLTACVLMKEARCEDVFMRKHSYK